jgi:hypothetical protein
VLKSFPILRSWVRLPDGHCGWQTDLSAIPWDLIQPHGAQAKANHGGQTLRRLAQRGGLSPCEAVAVLEDRKWTPMNAEDAQRRLRELMTEPARR